MSENLEDSAPQMNPWVKLEEISVYELLSTEGLTIPEYQRPYMWTKDNVRELFSDLDSVYENKQKFDDKFKYRLGSIILFHKDNKYEIVDGQQRIITLFLIMSCLKNDPDKSKELSIPLSALNKESVKHIKENSVFIQNKIFSDEKYKKELENLFENNIFVMKFIVIGDESVAFQLFDSHNSRGKPLFPHDLLKAHHLREMRNEPYSKGYAETFVEEEINPESSISEKWDNLCSRRTGPLSIHSLFYDYLFRLYKWVRKESAKYDSQKTDKELVKVYKGFSKNSSYRISLREQKASPLFKVGEPTCSGSDFFEMVFYYHSLLEKIINSFERKEELNKSKGEHTQGSQESQESQESQQSDQTKDKNQLKQIKEIFDVFNNCDTFALTKELFYLALLLYYDRFGRLDDQSLKTIFAWASVLRVEHPRLEFTTVDTYAKGIDSLLIKINSALNHYELHELYSEYVNKINRTSVEKKQNVYILRNKIKEVFN